MAGPAQGGAPVTLGDLARDRRLVWIWCHHCARGRRLRADTLARRLGEDFPVPGLAARLRCRACGGREVDARPDWPAGGVVTSHRWHED